MFTTLLESGGRATRHERWLSASTGVHLMLIAAAVTLTPPREAEKLDPPEQIDTFFIDELPQRPAYRETRAASGSPREGQWTFPSIRQITDVVGITTPDIDVAPGQGSFTNDIGSADPRCNDTSVCVAIPPLGGAPMSVGQVDKPAIQLPGNPRPVYPEMLRTAGVEGSALMRFVIDTTGAVEPRSIVVARADHELFGAAVKSVLLKSRFLPAEATGRKVRMLVEQRFDFAIDK